MARANRTAHSPGCLFKLSGDSVGVLFVPGDMADEYFRVVARLCSTCCNDATWTPPIATHSGGKNRNALNIRLEVLEINLGKGGDRNAISEQMV